MRAFLEWESNSEPNLRHYRLYWGLTPGVYTAMVDEIPPSGLATVTHVLLDLPNRVRVYFAVSAVNLQLLEGPLSDEASKVNREINVVGS